MGNLMSQEPTMFWILKSYYDVNMERWWLVWHNVR